MTEPDPPSQLDLAGTAAADLLNLLAHNQPPGAAAIEYDGHVALALDAGASLEIAPMLDALTSSCQLFDVPALDCACASDDASPA